jgi:hypothetical protein
MAWRAQGIRFVLYPAPGAALPEAFEVWKTVLTGREPETIQRPRAGAPGVTQSLAQGTVRELQTTITVQPTRLDLLVGPQDPWGGDRALALKDVLTPATTYGTKIVDLFAASRLALVFDCFQETDGWAASVAKFRDEVPLNTLPATARETTFVVNVTRELAALPGSTMNRLCKWETALLQQFLVTGQAGLGAQPILGNQRHMLNYQTDLSSEIRNAALEKAVAQATLVELAEETRLLVDQGYQRLTS